MPPRKPRATAAAARPDARLRLLQAAEQLIAAYGLPAVRTRELVATAEVNISQIAYYFGGVDGLICEVLDANGSRFLARQKELASALGADCRREDVLHALLAPLFLPAAHLPEVSAALILQEVLTHADPALTQPREQRFNQSFQGLLRRLVPLCAPLDADTVLWRFCCICGGGIGMSPRAPAWKIYGNLGGTRPLGDPRDVAELVATANGALSVPAMQNS
jgi:AcrR family transcriptional regulator